MFNHKHINSNNYYQFLLFCRQFLVILPAILKLDIEKPLNIIRYAQWLLMHQNSLEKAQL